MPCSDGGSRSRLYRDLASPCQASGLEPDYTGYHRLSAAPYGATIDHAAVPAVQRCRADESPSLSLQLFSNGEETVKRQLQIETLHTSVIMVTKIKHSIDQPDYPNSWRQLGGERPFTSLTHILCSKGEHPPNINITIPYKTFTKPFYPPSPANTRTEPSHPARTGRSIRPGRPPRSPDAGSRVER